MLGSFVWSGSVGYPFGWVTVSLIKTSRTFCFTRGRYCFSRNRPIRAVAGDGEGEDSERTMRNLDPPGPRGYQDASQTALQRVARYVRTGALYEFEQYLRKRPIRQLTAGSIAILLGFFSATSAATIIGSVADWDPLAAAVLILWTEGFTRKYYSTSKPSSFLRLLNAFKIGLTYGMIVDALKLST
uniref:Uncharacterized protein ycf20 n=1 Tax=Compsopogon caeruleus TaxID=31354 RepID=A0A7S1TEA8_9RHOD